MSEEPKSTKPMRDRARELATPPRDDFDRAVLAVLDDMDAGVLVTGIHLVRIGQDVIVNAEIDGKWVEVIREFADGSFSHIVEPGGMRREAAKAEART